MRGEQSHIAYCIHPIGLSDISLLFFREQKIRHTAKTDTQRRQIVEHSGSSRSQNSHSSQSNQSSVKTDDKPVICAYPPHRQRKYKCRSARQPESVSAADCECSRRTALSAVPAGNAVSSPPDGAVLFYPTLPSISSFSS